MIEVNELRIGSLINTPNRNMNPFKVEFIESIGLGKIGGFNNVGNFVYWLVKDVNPIELNGDWLIQNSFKYTDGEDACDCIYNLNGVNIWEHDNGFCHSYGYGGYVDSIHKLQSLYNSITGTELIIK